MLEHSRVSTVHTQHTTPPPHTLFAKTPWAFTEDARDAFMLHSRVSTHSTRHPSLYNTYFTPFHPQTQIFSLTPWAFIVDVREADILLEHSRVSTVNTQHTTPPPHTLFAKTRWAFTEDRREADILLEHTVHTQHTTPPLRYNLLSTHPFTKTPWAFTKVVREGGYIVGAQKSVQHKYSTQHPFSVTYNLFHTPLYKDTLGVQRGCDCETGGHIAGTQQGVHCSHTANDTL